MIVLAALAVLAHVADFLTFIPMVLAHGLAAEANPIVVMIAENTGLLGLVTFKTAAITFAVGLAFLIRRVSPQLAGFILLFGFMAGAIAAAMNVATI